MLRVFVHVAVVLVVVVSGVAGPAFAATPVAEQPRAVTGPTTPQVSQTTASSCTFPFTETDSTGTSVTVKEPPERVVTLSPSAAQTMWEIKGARDKVVGVNPNSYYLDGAATREPVFDLLESGFYSLRPNVSKVAALEPDVVLAPNVIKDSDVESLRAEGLTVYKFRPANSVEFIYQKTRLTGRLVDECDDADNRTAELRAQVDTVRRATAGVDRKLVLYEFFGFTTNDNYYISDVIEIAGGENLGSRYGQEFEPGTYGYKGQNFGTQYPDLQDKFATADPAWIVKPTGAPVPTAFSATTAVRQNQTVSVNSNFISQPAPRVVIAMTQIVRALYPERYRLARLGLLAEEAEGDSGTWEIPYADADPTYTTVEDGDAVLRVQNGDPPTTRWTVPESFAPNSSVRLTELAVSTREPNPIYSVRVRNATSDSPPLPGNATLLAAYEPSTEDLFAQPTGAEPSVRVPLEQVADDSRLVVYQRTSDGWTALPTERSVNETSQTVTVTASMDVLRDFAVGVASTDTPPAPEPSTPDQSTATPTAVPTTSPTPTATATASPTPTATSTASPTPTAGGGPGFGAVAALTALLAGALLALRRR